MFITNIIVFTILVIPDIIVISDISCTMHRLLHRGCGILKPSDIFLGSGPQRSVCRLQDSGQVQCTSWRNFAPFSSSTFKTIHGEQAGKRDRGGSAVGARHIVREHDTTQTCIKQGYKTSAKPNSPWSPSQEGARGQGSSACRGTPSRGEARALHHQPVPALTVTMPCISCSRPTFDRWIHQVPLEHDG